MRAKLLLCLMGLLMTTFSYADPFQIPVTSGGPPDCTTRLYNQILVPGGWGNDNGAATRFAQSPEGVLGATIMYELGVNGDVNSYSGQAAMVGIGEDLNQSLAQ